MIPLEKQLGLVVVLQSHFQNFTSSLVPTLGVRPRAETSSSFFQKLGGGSGDGVFLFLEPAASDWPRLVTRLGLSPLIGRDENEMLPSDNDFDDDGTGRDTDDDVWYFVISELRVSHCVISWASLPFSLLFSF